MKFFMNVFEEKFSRAIEMVKNSVMESPNKPVIPHALRVGELLYEKGFSDDVVNAGLLHDLLEWSGVVEKDLEEKFGRHVVDLVKANTKDRSIAERDARRQAQIDACLKIGDDALAIKIADNIDSFCYYSKNQNEKELQRCKDWNELLTEHASDALKKIFEINMEDIKTA